MSLRDLDGKLRRNLTTGLTSMKIQITRRKLRLRPKNSDHLKTGLLEGMIAEKHEKPIF